MFDEDDYYSEQEDEAQRVIKHTPAKKVLIPSSASDFNHLTGQSENLLKMMQERGLDINENQARKLRANNSSKQKQSSKSKQKAGFFDGGASASFEQLVRALNKALSSADPQQASAVLTHILDKKNLSETDRNKFGVMKCKILFGLGAFKDCLELAEKLMKKQIKNQLTAAILSNYLAKSRGQLGLILEGYMDFLRADAHLQAHIRSESIQSSEKKQKQQVKPDQFEDSQSDAVAREIDHTEMQYNIKMAKYKNNTNLVFPYFSQFRHRQVLQVSCGDYHTLFLVSGALGGQESPSEVFGLGENAVGQVLGYEGKQMIKEPILLVQLSGKQICGIHATRESSLAWDGKGQIYEWGIKQKRDQQINITFTLNQKITQLQKGYQHYAALTSSGKFYTWGNILCKGSNIYKQAQPYQQPTQNTMHISCGSSHIVAVDSYGDAFVLGSNEHGQLGLQGELHARTFKKFSSNYIGLIRKAVCIGDSTFFITREEELYFTGRISFNRQPIQKPRQGEFTGDLRFITSLVGTTGNYYITNELGELYHWQVDSSVKFKLERQNQKVPQRSICSTKSSLYKVRSMILPQMTKIKLLTQQLKSYEDIEFQIKVSDKLGPFGNPGFVLPPRCQIFFSTYAISGNELQKENKLFLESYQFSSDDSKILVNQIIESRLTSYKIVRNQVEPWSFKLTISSEESGKFYFYILLEEKVIYSQELNISVSEREKELSEKNKRQKQLRQQQRKRKAEMQRQRMLQQKLKKQTEQQQKRKQTQKRAEQAFKKYMRQQQQLKSRAQQQRKARKELLTGGGFDLSKLRAKNEKIEMVADKSTTDMMQKSTQSFLPDINARPNSRRKVNLPTKNSMILTGFDSVKPLQRQSSKNDDLGSTGINMMNVNLFKSESNKQKEVPSKATIVKGSDSLSKTVAGTGKMLVRRGVSKGKK